ncbi:MAG: TonB-dependent receptor plug domain-containing protein [Vulcanimicrobiaceae bacterium]
MRAAAFWVAFSLCLLLAASRVSAQSIDYGATEQLFGEPITTSVTGSPQRASAVPATMVIITADAIRRSGASDIPGVLRHVAGVDVLQWRNDDADVAVRGYNQPYSPRLLVLIDGRQVYADYYGYTPWSALPVELSEIRQIEVVKGPNSALFGFNAVGGVINIVTYNPLYDRVNTASINVGTQALAEGSAVASFKLGSTGGVRIAAGGRSNEDFSTPESPLEVGTRRGNDRGEINARAVMRLGRNVVSEFEATTSASDGPELTTGYATYYSHYQTQSAKLQVAADSRAGLIQGTVYSNWITLQTSSNLPSLFSSIHAANQVAVAQLQDLFKVGSRDTFRASVEYRHNAMPTITGGGQISYGVASASGMWDWTVTPSLSLNNAVRLDHLTLNRNGSPPAGYGLTNAAWNDRSLSETSFNTGLVWRPDALDTFRLTAARGVELPSLFDLGGLLLQTPVGFISGVPSLNPEIVTNYEVGWDRSLSGGAQLRLSAYHETARDIVALLAGSDFSAGLIATPANIGGSDATGVELSLKGTFRRYWRWSASYTPEVITDHFEPGFTLATTGVNYAQTTPVHVANAGLGWARGPWETDGYLRYESAFYGIVPTPDVNATNGETLSLIPAYVSVDARIGYKLNDRLTLSLSGQNITQSPQRQTSAPDVERRLIGMLKIKF